MQQDVMLHLFVLASQSSVTVGSLYIVYGILYRLAQKFVVTQNYLPQRL